MRTLFFDCVSGASGDMILGALLDAGADLNHVRGEVDALGLTGWDLRFSTVTKSGIRAGRCEVIVEETGVERNYADIVALLDKSPLGDRVRARAGKAFELLARAESKVHGIGIDDVHFHEVGALDAIVDIVGSAAAVTSLAPDLIVTSAIPTGRGFVDSSHGPLPVPAPAVVEILSGATLFERGDQELITPTGAALLAAFTDRFGEMPPLRLEATGYGAGGLDLEVPNVLRVLVGSSPDQARTPTAALLVETNIDDMNTELFPYVIEQLIVAGAQDAWLTPIVMKKGRAALSLSVLAGRDGLDRVLDVIYRETTTLGVRIREIAKDELGREWVEVSVEGTPVRVKVGRRAGQAVTMSPEHDDAVRAARATGLPLKEVYGRATQAAQSEIRSH